jgi:hypothetical protein
LIYLGLGPLCEGLETNLKLLSNRNAFHWTLDVININRCQNKRVYCSRSSLHVGCGKISIDAKIKKSAAGEVLRKSPQTTKFGWNMSINSVKLSFDL